MTIHLETKHFHKIIVIIAAIVFAISAYCSVGFHHFDEHFQILEFAGLKLGINQEKDMAWEYQAKIRPAIQPAVVVVIVKTLRAVGITSPFKWTLILRILTGALILFSIYCTTLALLPTLSAQHQKLFIGLSYFLYFIPYIAVRFSSETVSSGFFLLGFSLLIYSCRSSLISKPSILFSTGLLLGTSFICRFQCGILIAGLLLWLAVIYRLAWFRISIIVLGIAGIVGIGVLIDHWFYGQWIFTPLNYIRVDILSDDAAKFGTSPWYFYLSELLRGDARSMIKLIILLGAIYYLFSNRRDIVTFAVVPFVLIHLLIAHKEMRFLIPVAFFASYIIVVFWQYFSALIKKKRTVQIMQLILFQALFLNTLSLMANMIKPADGQPLVYEYLYDHFGDKTTDVYYIDRGRNFFWSQALLPMNFYDPMHHEIGPIDLRSAFEIALAKKTKTILLIAHRNIDMSGISVKALYSTKPFWLQAFDLNDWMRIKNDDWMIYQVLIPKAIKTK